MTLWVVSGNFHSTVTRTYRAYQRNATLRMINGKRLLIICHKIFGFILITLFSFQCMTWMKTQKPGLKRLDYARRITTTTLHETIIIIKNTIVYPGIWKM